MTHISDIDVNGINTNLKVRFARDDIYTYTGTILVAVNPYKSLKIYEKVRCDVRAGFRGARLSHLSLIASYRSRQPGRVCFCPQETIERYSGKKMGSLPPHVFATAQAALMNIQKSTVNQSCVISGESGAGKVRVRSACLSVCL